MQNVTITLEPTLLKMARKKAKQECRSLSKQIAFLILQDTAATKSAIKVNEEGGAQ
jgi:hypothetical protein